MPRILRFLLLSGSFLFTAAQASANTPTEQVDELLTQAQLLITDDIDDAEALIEEALEIAPERADVNFLCGQIMGMQASQAIFSALSYAGKSLDCFKQAAALEPDNTEYQFGLMMFYLQAPGIAGGDIEKAWKLVGDISALDTVAGTRARLQYYASTEEESAFEETLSNALATYPEHAEFYYQYGLHLQQQKNYSEALNAFKQATNASIDDPESHYKLSALYQIGRNAVLSKLAVLDGIDALQRYINTAIEDANLPSQQWAHYRLAQLYQLNDDNDAMQTHLKLAATTDDKRLLDSLDAF